MKKMMSMIIIIFFFCCLFNFNFIERANATLTGYSESGGNNGYIWVANSNWDTGHDTASSSNCFNTEWYVGCWYAGVQYTFRHGYCIFDTSAIPDTAIITKVNLSYTVDGVNGGGCRIQYLCDSDTPWYPQTTLTNGDFQLSLYDKKIGLSVLRSTTGLKNDTLSNYSFFMNKTGVTRFACVEYDHDYLDVPVTPVSTYYGVEILSETTMKLWVTYLVNYKPVLTVFSPSDYSVYISQPLTVSVKVNDTNHDLMNLKFRTNASGTWTTIGWWNNTYNATCINSTNLFSSTNHTYYYSANVTDGYEWTNQTVHFWIVAIPSCPSHSLTVYNNTAHTTGKYQTSYSSSTGWKIWLNYTGELPVFNHYENIINATGTHQYNTGNSGYTINSWANYTGTITPFHTFDNIGYAFGTHFSKLNSTGYWDWANYTTGLLKDENIVNATGTHESKYNIGTGNWEIWANYTGDTTPIEIINNTVNVSGKYNNIFDSLGYHIYLNYSGIGGICPDELKLYLFENIINATGTHDYIKNDTGYVVYANYTGDNGSSFDPNATDDWLYLGAMLTVDDSQYYLLILVSLWAFFIFIFADKKETLYAFCIICFGLPLGIIISGIAFFNSYPFGYLISFIIILVSFLIPSYSMYKKNKK